MQQNWNRLWKWDHRFLELAEFYSKWSKDPSTKVGAVIAHGKLQVSQGYNGYPTYVGGDEAEDEREVKYGKIIHAEMNALIFMKNATLFDMLTLYTYPMLPCHRCAPHMIQAGISKIVAPYSDNERWVDSIEKSKEMFDDAGIKVIEVIYNEREN